LDLSGQVLTVCIGDFTMLKIKNANQELKEMQITVDEEIIE